VERAARPRRARSFNLIDELELFGIVTSVQSYGGRVLIIYPHWVSDKKMVATLERREKNRKCSVCAKLHRKNGANAGAAARFESVVS
jgi:hypothetical protein